MARSGVATLCEELLSTLLADTAEFRTWVGAIDAAAALLSIHRVAAEPETDAVSFPYPYALIYPEVPYMRESFSSGGQNDFGTLVVEFRDAVPSGDQDSHEDAYDSIMNDIGAIESGIWTQMNTGAQDYLFMTSFSITERPKRAGKGEANTKASGDYYTAKASVDWGMRE